MSPEVTFFITIWEKFGIPGVVLVLIGITLRFLAKECVPYVKRYGEAVVNRQNAMAKGHEDLTSATIKIQQDNAELQRSNHTLLTDLKADLRSFCAFRQGPPQADK